VELLGYFMALGRLGHINPFFYRFPAIKTGFCLLINQIAQQPMKKTFFNVAYVIDDSKVAGKLHCKVLQKLEIADDIRNYCNPIEGLKDLIADLVTHKKVLLLIDLDMPNLNGVDLLEVLSKLQIDPQQLSVYIISSTLGEHLDKEILYNRFVRRHLTKPLKKEELVIHQLKLLYQRKKSLKVS